MSFLLIFRRAFEWLTLDKQHQKRSDPKHLCRRSKPLHVPTASGVNEWSFALSSIWRKLTEKTPAWLKALSTAASAWKFNLSETARSIQASGIISRLSLNELFVASRFANCKVNCKFKLTWQKSLETKYKSSLVTFPRNKSTILRYIHFEWKRFPEEKILRIKFP